MEKEIALVGENRQGEGHETKLRVSVRKERHAGPASNRGRSKGHRVPQDKAARPSRPRSAKLRGQSGRGRALQTPASHCQKVLEGGRCLPGRAETLQAHCMTHSHLLGMKIQVLFKAAERLFSRK